MRSLSTLDVPLKVEKRFVRPDEQRFGIYEKENCNALS
jgi:hypothetical protein